jgi:hypothetical protein
MEFKDEYWFLNNMCETPITYKDLTYRNVEAAFQAQKCPDRAEEFVNLKGFEARKLGRKIKPRKDWNDVKESIMLELLEIKFSRRKYKKKLLRTEDEEIIYDNNWKDTFWGRYDGEGENVLGKLIMSIRDELQNSKLAPTEPKDII